MLDKFRSQKWAIERYLVFDCFVGQFFSTFDKDEIIQLPSTAQPHPLLLFFSSPNTWNFFGQENMWMVFIRIVNSAMLGDAQNETSTSKHWKTIIFFILKKKKKKKHAVIIGICLINCWHRKFNRIAGYKRFSAKVAVSNLQYRQANGTKTKTKVEHSPLIILRVRLALMFSLQY